MLASWIELLPLFIVRRLARRYCERVSVHGDAWITARRDVLIRFKDRA